MSQKPKSHASRTDETKPSGDASPLPGTILPRRRSFSLGVARPAVIRLLLMTASVGGVVAAAGFWIGGSGRFAARLLAGDIVVAVLVLLL